MAADAAFDRKGQTMKADRTSAADRARFVLIASTPPSRSHRSAGTRKPILGFNNKDECGAVLSGEESQNLFVGLCLICAPSASLATLKVTKQLTPKPVTVMHAPSQPSIEISRDAAMGD